MALRDGRGGRRKKRSWQQGLWQHPEEIILIDIPDLAVLDGGALGKGQREVHMLAVKYYVGAWDLFMTRLGQSLMRLESIHRLRSWVVGALIHVWKKQQDGQGSTYVILELIAVEPYGSPCTQCWFRGIPALEWACVVRDHSYWGSPGRELNNFLEEMHIKESSKFDRGGTIKDIIIGSRAAHDEIPEKMAGVFLVSVRGWSCIGGNSCR